ncbi:MAG: NAD(P)H-hydrate epimerase, partial [Thiotrichaceae bacterium]|nr:NAD(P)H-hydrate epimerase [Thiotrichaceae bacterium]
MNYNKSSSKNMVSSVSPHKNERYSFVHYCYSREVVRNLDYLMVEQGIVNNSYELMTRAAQALLDFIYLHYPEAAHLTILCGAGNNAGDGYVLARLAVMQEHEPQLKVDVISVFDVEHLAGDARHAYDEWLECGGTVKSIMDSRFKQTDLVVDALIGTGLNRDLEDEWYDAVAQINLSEKPVLAVDIPSGLDANTGVSYGIAVQADHTMTFIGQKMGMYTAEARCYCGEIHFASLGVPEVLYDRVEHGATLLEWVEVSKLLPHRSPVSHKGDHGHLLIIGGDYGMVGACRIAGEAALRTGAGLVSIATHQDNVNAISSARPELMVHAVEHGEDLDKLLNKANAIAIGPGLGSSQWGISLLDRVIKFLKNQPDFNQGVSERVHCVIDADALNIMARHNIVIQNKNIIYTPHFGEACRLLKMKSLQPSATTNRFDIIKDLKEKYHG